jgi:hypothetical protein
MDAKRTLHAKPLGAYKMGSAHPGQLGSGQERKNDKRALGGEKIQLQVTSYMLQVISLQVTSYMLQVINL